MSFETLGTDAVSTIDIKTSLGSHNFPVDDDLGAYLAKVHSDQASHRDIGTARFRLQPDAAKVPKNNKANKAEHHRTYQQSD